MREGQGIEKGPFGTYDGEWHEGLKHGKGVMSYKNGSSYDGEWFEGEIRGKGTYKENVTDAFKKKGEDGPFYNIYEGEMKEN